MSEEFFNRETIVGQSDDLRSLRTENRSKLRVDGLEKNGKRGRGGKRFQTSVRNIENAGKEMEKNETGIASMTRVWQSS